LEEILLGHPIDLKAKAGGEKSMSEKRETREDAEGVVLQGPCDMAKAELPESQSPVVEPTPSPLQRLGAVLSGVQR
jgi:hypothetical protein